MGNTYWLKQARDKPLFEDLIWSRPENKRQAGKLLVIGGNKHGFAAPAAAYSAANRAGIGSCRVLIPESLRKIVGTLLEADFGPSNPSGSFARTALDSFLENAHWADGVLLAGNLGRNSETAIVLDKFVEKFSGQLIVAGDSLDYFLNTGSTILDRENTTMVINLGKLQRLAKNINPDVVIKHSYSLAEMIRKLADWSQTTRANFVTRHQDQLITAVAGKVSTIPWEEDQKWQVELPAYICVWQIQNPSKTFEAITTAIFEATK